MPDSFKKFLQRWIITTVAVMLAAQIVSGISYDSFGGLLAASLVLGILNAFCRPIIFVLSLPLVIFSLGVFVFVINALLLYMVGAIVKPFHVATFWAAFKGALIISIVSFAANLLLGKSQAKITFQRKPPAPPTRHDHDDQGPIIDV